MINKRWLVITILTFITISAWVILDIIHAQANVEIPPKTKDIIEPVSPNFDIQILKSKP